MGQTVGWALNVTEYVFPPVRPSYDETHDFLVNFPSGAEADIPAMLVPPLPGATQWKRSRDSSAGSTVSVCVIYFHPNACDIGDCITDMASIRDGVFRGDAIVLAPEYCGYGLLVSYQPSVESIDLVATAAWRYCRKTLGFRAEQIVLWGRSIGTGPAASVAQWRGKRAVEKGRRVSRSRPVGALVLLAPFTSVSNVVQWHTNTIVASLVSPMWEVSDLVKEPGLEDVPLCVVHPREDEVVPLAHGQAVLEAGSSKFKFCLWLSGATHNFNLEVEHLNNLRTFLTDHLGRERQRISWTAKDAGDIFFPDLSNANMVSPPESARTGSKPARRHSHDGMSASGSRSNDVSPSALLSTQSATSYGDGDSWQQLGAPSPQREIWQEMGDKFTFSAGAAAASSTDSMRGYASPSEMLSTATVRPVDDDFWAMRGRTRPQDPAGREMRTSRHVDQRPQFPVEMSGFRLRSSLVDED